MKLTDNILDQLIAEQIELNEKQWQWDQAQDKKLQGLGQQQFNRIARVSIATNNPDPADEKDNKDRTLSNKDIEILIDNPDLIDSYTEHLLIKIRDGAQDDELIDLAKKALDSYKRERTKAAAGSQSVTQPIIRTAPAERGEFNSEVESLLRSVFKGDESITKRVKIISQISDKYYQATQGNPQAINSIKRKSKRKVMSEIMLLDYLAEIVKSFDSGAGGYVFEYFLALLSGGNVAGKETGPSGGMGGVDFRSKGGAGGSAKYYNSTKGITQSAGGFNKDEAVDYIIGIKKQRHDFQKTAGGTSDPSRIIAIDIYALRFTRISDLEFSVQKITKAGEISGNVGKYSVTKSKDAKGNDVYSKIDISSFIGNRTYLDTIRIAEVRTKTFKDMIYKGIQASNKTKFKPMIEAMEKYIQSMRIAEVKSKIYSSEEGNMKHGNEAFEALFAAENHMEELVLAIDPESTVSGAPQGQRKISENNQKITEEILDKLIEEVILTK